MAGERKTGWQRSGGGRVRGLATAWVWWAVLVMPVVGLSGVSLGQPSPAELRKRADELAAENEQLRRENEALRAQLAEALALRDTLAAELARAEAGLRSVREGMERGEAPAEPAVAMPTDPMASPASMLAAMRERYRVDVEAGSTGEPVAVRQRRVEAWTGTIGAEFSGKALWLVRIARPVELEDRRFETRVQIVEGRSGLNVGEAITLEVPAKFARLVESRNDEKGLWKLTVGLEARPGFNAARVEPGAFDFPPLIGAFAEFRLGIEWLELSEWDASRPMPLDPPTVPGTGGVGRAEPPAKGGASAGG